MKLDNAYTHLKEKKKQKDISTNKPIFSFCSPKFPLFQKKNIQHMNSYIRNISCEWGDY